MTTVGRLTEFDASSDSVAAYVERTQLFFEANSIEEGKQVAVFLSAIGPKTYKLLRDLMAPTRPKKPLKDIIAVLEEHFEPKPLVIAERFHFHRRQQRVGESIAQISSRSSDVSLPAVNSKRTWTKLSETGSCAA